MAFRRNVKFPADMRCWICRKKIEQGKEIELYSSFMPGVCDNCYKTYFKEIEKTETGAAVKFRPALVYTDRYMLKNVFASMLLKDIIMWPLIGAALWLICFAVTSSYPSGLVPSKPFFMRGTLMIYAVLTVPGMIGSVCLFIRGCLRGANTSRRVLLIIKLVIYIICCVAAVMISII